MRDPNPYDGPIERLDGHRPYNHYLWPMEGDSWWVSEVAGLRGMAHPNHVAIVALADGRWSTSGSIYAIEENCDCYGSPCVYQTREETLRVAVARFIRTCRNARNWGTLGISHDTCQIAVNWALDIVGRPHVALPTPPPVRRLTGMPLFDADLHTS